MYTLKLYTYNVTSGYFTYHNYSPLLVVTFLMEPYRFDTSNRVDIRSLVPNTHGSPARL